MERISLKYRLQVSAFVTAPAFLSLVYMFIAYKYRIYEMVFFAGLRDVSAMYPGIQAQYGIGAALKQIYQLTPWYVYSAIVFILTFTISSYLYPSKKGMLRYIGMFIKIFIIYTLSTFLCLISVLGSHIFSKHYDKGLEHLEVSYLYHDMSYMWIWIEELMYSFYFGGSEVYAPYALPSIFAAFIVMVGIIKFMPNQCLKSTSLPLGDLG